MTVTNTTVGSFSRISGTIAEVMAELEAQTIVKAQQVVYYTDDDSKAVILVSRIAN